MSRRTAKAAAKAARRGTASVMPAKLTQGVLTAKSWYDDQQRIVWSVLAGVLIVAGAWFGIGAYLGKSKHESADLLRIAVATANAPILAAEDEQPEEATVDESYPSVQARATKARERFHQVIDHFPRSEAAAWARVGEANAQSELGKHAAALVEYDKTSANTDLPPLLRWRALEGAGYALEAQQKYAEAAKRFEAIANLNAGAYRAAADFHRARMYLALGQPQKAADLLQALVKAERARPPGEGGRFQALLSDAETLLTELSVQLNDAKLRADIPAAPVQGIGQARDTQGAGPASGQGQQITEEIVEALRKQLESGKGGKGLTKEVVDALAEQAKQGEGASPQTPVHNPPATQPESRKNGAQPAKDKPR
jgi:tetratricopeptide (TPR) repeat protein